MSAGLWLPCNHIMPSFPSVLQLSVTVDYNRLPAIEWPILFLKSDDGPLGRRLQRRLGGDPCGVDPRIDLGLDRLRSQGSTLDRSGIDFRISVPKSSVGIQFSDKYLVSIYNF